MRATRCRVTIPRIWLPRYASFSASSSVPADQFADAVVLGVADIDCAIGADDCAMRSTEPGGGRRAAVTAWAFAPASDRFDNPARSINAADRVILSVDDQDVAARIEGQF